MLFKSKFVSLIYLLLCFATHCSNLEVKDTVNRPPSKRAPYGFLSDFSPMSESAAQQKVQQMVHNFGIKDFQFYDWFAGYSTPTSGGQWKDAFFKKKPISMDTILTYIQEIHRLGGRAWAYVQATASENPSLDYEDPNIHPVTNEFGGRYLHAGVIPIYNMNATLGVMQTDIWADTVKKMGFDGIHWDTLGSLSADKKAEELGVHEFLKITKSALEKKGLLQTLNFIDMVWLDEKSVRYVEFPYCESWDVEMHTFISKMTSLQTNGVFVKYSSYISGDNDVQFQKIVAMCQTITASGNTMLIVGDGRSRLRTEYFPSRTAMNMKELNMTRTCLHP